MHAGREGAPTRTECEQVTLRHHQWHDERRPKLFLTVEHGLLPPSAIQPYLVRTGPFLRLFDGNGGTYSEASHGVTGNQDAYFCAGSPVQRRGR